jgi:hypothetical protein
VGYWRKKGVDLHKLKKDYVGNAGGEYDVYVDSKGKVWLLRKGESEDKAIPVGEERDIVNDPDYASDKGRERSPPGRAPRRGRDVDEE